MDVKLPDGRIITNVPEGTTKAQLMARVNKLPTPLAEEMPPAPTELEDSFTGDVQRAAAGRVIGMAQLGDTLSDYNPVDWLVKKILPEKMIQENEGKRKVFRENLSDVAHQLQYEQEQRGIKSLPGAIIGDPLTYVPIGSAINAPTKLGRAGQAAKNAGLFGAIGGLTDPLTSDQSRGEHTLLQGGLSAATGAVMQPAIDLVSTGVRKLGNVIFAPNAEKIAQIDEAAKLIQDPEIAKHMKPTIQAVTDKPWVSATANVMENVPFAGRQFKKTAQGYEAAANELASQAGLRGVVQPEDAGRTVESGLKNAFGRADINEEKAWNAVDSIFPPTSPVEAVNVERTIRGIAGGRPGMTQQQVAEESASPILKEAQKAFPEKFPALGINKAEEESARRTTTYGALNQARRDVFNKAKDLSTNQPGTAGEESAKAASLYAAFKADVRNQMEKSGVDPAVLDEADKATQVSKGIASKVEDYFGKIRRKVTPNGAVMEIERVSEKTPEAAFGRLASSLEKGGTEIKEIRGLLDPEENLRLTDALYKHYASDEHGISKIKWAKAFRGMTDEGKIGFANNDPQLALELSKFADAVGNLEKVQGFDHVKGVGRFVASSGIASAPGILALLTGIHLGGAYVGGGATIAALSKIMNDPNIVRAITDYTTLAPTKLSLDKRAAIQAINKAIANSAFLDDKEKGDLIKLNEQPTPTPAKIQGTYEKEQEGGGAGSDKLSPDIVHAEGLRLKAYNDHLGNKTVGYGFNMDDTSARKRWAEAGLKTPFQAVKRGRLAITPQEAKQLANYSYKIAANDAKKLYPNFSKLSKNRQQALINMSYQMGLTNLSGFKDANKAIANGRFNAAVRHFAKSRWVRQTPERARKILTMLWKDVPYDKA